MHFGRYALKAAITRGAAASDVTAPPVLSQAVAPSFASSMPCVCCPCMPPQTIEAGPSIPGDRPHGRSLPPGRVPMLICTLFDPWHVRLFESENPLISPFKYECKSSPAGWDPGFASPLRLPWTVVPRPVIGMFCLCLGPGRFVVSRSTVLHA